ncbi:MAG: hypothetical protein ACREWI_14865 [Telluria sp.]
MEKKGPERCSGFFLSAHLIWRTGRGRHMHEAAGPDDLSLRAMQPLSLFFLLPDVAGVATPCAHACCLPAPPHPAEPDVWLLLAGLVVWVAGRLARHPRG